MSWARQEPETTKEPERSLSPGFFSTGSASPVIMASFTVTVPERTRASALIWSPAEKRAMSSRTMWLVGRLSSTPSRTTVPRGEARRVSLSTVRLERIS